MNVMDALAQFFKGRWGGALVEAPTQSLLRPGDDDWCSGTLVRLIGATGDALASQLLADYVHSLTWEEILLLRQKLQFSWHDVPPSVLMGYVADDTEVARCSKVALLSFHYDGYSVRQDAVKGLAACETGEELPFLILRANDWVPQIAQIALEALERRVCRADYAKHFAQWLPAVIWLQRQSRHNRSDLPTRVYVQLLRPENRRFVRDLISSENSSLHRAALAVIVQGLGPEDADELMDALKHRENTVRLAAARRVLELFRGLEAIPFLGVMRKDCHSPVRNLAAEGFSRLDAAISEPVLQEMIFDKSGTVRQTARFYLSRIRDIDYVRAYEDALGIRQGRKLAAVISGLGEVATDEEAGLVEPYLTHSAPRVRRAAEKSLRELQRFGQSRRP